MSTRVVVSLITDEQEFQRMQAAEARETAARLGLEVVVLFAENSPVLQIQQLFKHLHAAAEERPLALVVESVAGEGLERVARNAAAAGVGWVLLNWNVPYVPALREASAGVLVASVAADEHEIGRIQARQCAALVPGGGPLLYVQGPSDTTTAQGRLQGLRESLGERFELKLLNGDWTEQSGYKAVNAWRRLRTSDTFRAVLVGAQNDAMAAGARRALLEQGPDWKRVPFIGCDGLPAGGRALVEKGELAATIVKPTTTGPALELVARWAGDHRRRGLADLVLAPRSFPPVAELARPDATPA